jgi:hypothetical protein
VTLARQCCCNPQEPLVCCGEWPTYCATQVGLGYWFYSLYRTQVYHNASINFIGGSANLTAYYYGATTAFDDELQAQVCSFPDPVDEFPYEVVMPGIQQIETRPFNYPVPVWRGTEPAAGEFEIVWPILQKCCIGGSQEKLVVGFELRNSALIPKLGLGVSPTNLTGLYNGTGRHWYTLSNGNFRFFADPGTWERDGLGPGLPSFTPFRLGQDSAPTLIEHNSANPMRFEHRDWCLENGVDNPCRCNFSFAEEPSCCEFYTATIQFQASTDGCATHTVSTSCVVRYAPSPCPQGFPQDVIMIKNTLSIHPSTVANGTYSVDKIFANGCCVDYQPPNPSIGTSFSIPVVTGAQFGCNLTPVQGCVSCDPYPPETFDAIFCVVTGYILDSDVPINDPCYARFVSTSNWLIGVSMRSEGAGCCIDSYQVRRAYYMDTSLGCVWRPLDYFNISFECEA